MANVIRHKRGTSTPSASDFSNTGEILVDTNSGNIFNKTDGNSVVKVNGINDLVDDTTPQLGGNLDMNSKFISSGILGVKNTGSQSELRLYCESNNAHYASIKAPAHGDFTDDVTLTLPASAGNQSIVGTTETQTLTNKTIDVDNNTISNIEVDNFKSGVVDTDLSSVSGNDDTLASAKAIKAYVDATAGGGGGGSPGGSNTQVQFNNSGSFGGSSNLTFDGTNLTVGGTVSGTSSASGTAGFRKITASTSAPSGGSDGDVWIKYTA